MSPRTIFQVLEHTAEQHGKAPAMHQPYTEGKRRGYRTYSWNEVKSAVSEIAAGLRQLGIKHGDVVALDSETRAEFYLADLGIMTSGSIAAGLYGSYPVAELRRTLRACGAKAVFAENPKTLAKLREGADPPLPVIWLLLTGEGEGATSLEKLREEGRRAMAKDRKLFGRIVAEVKPSDNAILYLTSGATGEPKMALVSHGAITPNLYMCHDVLDLSPADRTIAFLPSAHMAQRMVVELLPVSCGAQVFFLENLSRLPQDLKTVKPTVLLAPPRVWERIYQSVSTEIQKRSSVVQKLFYGALGVALEAAELRRQRKPVPRWMQASLKAADRMLFRKVRARFGGQVRIALSGAAPLGKKLAEFLEAIGLGMVEGYGLTEGGIVGVNPLDRPKPGTIGKAFKGVQVRLAEDGELLIKGPCLFSGYHNDPAATAQALRDGWLYTGDLAEIDDEGYISITGRKKELIVSSNGKKIYPSRIEALFKLEPVISQTFLVGDRLPYITALFTVNPQAAKPGSVQPEVQKAVRRVNMQLAPFEQIRKFHILDREFSLENGEMTPTMKLRRSRVLDNFRERIAELYSGKEESN